MREFASDLNPVACLFLRCCSETFRATVRAGEELRGRRGNKEAGGEGTRPVLPARSRWGEADRLPMGADRYLRVTELRRGNPACSIVLAV